MSVGFVQAHSPSGEQLKINNIFFISGRMELITADITFMKVINEGEGAENTNIFDQLSDDCTV